MAGAMITLTKDDFDGDPRTVSWEVKDVAAQATHAAYIAANDALVTQINGWSAGRDHRTEYTERIADVGAGKASSPIAQAKLRLIIEGEDAVTGSIYRFPITMPDLAKADDGVDPAWIAVGQGSNSLTVMNPDHAAYATFKTQFELTAQSPNGNDVLMVRGYIEE